MASALRCLARATKLTQLTTTKEILASVNFKLLSRNYSYSVSPKVQDLDESKLPEFEVSQNPEEWKYVERLMTGTTVPIPKQFDGPAPSGWVPPRVEAKKHPYFVRRTKNHMEPVYLDCTYRGQRHITVIRYIEGDIWQMEQELKTYIAEKLKKKVAHIGTSVNEMSRKIKIRGDCVALTKQWLHLKGF